MNFCNPEVVELGCCQILDLRLVKMVGIPRLQFLLVSCLYGHCTCTVRVDITILDSLGASTQVCSISIPVTPLDVNEHAL